MDKEQKNGDVYLVVVMLVSHKGEELDFRFITVGNEKPPKIRLEDYGYTHRKDTMSITKVNLSKVARQSGKTLRLEPIEQIE